MKVLVTGSDGFIGKHVVNSLSQQGHEVRKFDLPSSIIKRETCWLHVSGCDAIVHLAAATDRYAAEEDATNCMMTNVIGTQRLLSAARLAGVKRVVAASSLRSLANAKGVVPLIEDSPVAPASLFGASKLAMEGVLWDSPISTYILRLTTVYGPGGEAKGGLIARAFEAARKSNSKPTLRGDGFAERKLDLVYVEDVVRAVGLALQDDRHDVIINVGFGRSHSMGHILNAVQTITGVPTETIWSEARRPNVPRVSIDRAKHLLGWEPRVDLIEGLRRTWEHLVGTQRQQPQALVA